MGGYGGPIFFGQNVLTGPVFYDHTHVLFIFLGEGSEQLTPPDISSDTLRNPPSITPVAQREFLRKRRLLDKMEIELLFSGLPGREAVKDFILHLHRRNCRSSTLRAYLETIQRFLSFLQRTGKEQLEALTGVSDFSGFLLCFSSKFSMLAALSL